MFECGEAYLLLMRTSHLLGSKCWLEEVWDYLFKSSHESPLPFTVLPTVVFRYSRPAAIFFTDTKNILRKREDVAALSATEILASLESTRKGVVCIHVTEKRARGLSEQDETVKSVGVEYMRAEEIGDFLSGHRKDKGGIVQMFQPGTTEEVTMLRAEWTAWGCKVTMERAAKKVYDRAASLSDRLTTFSPDGHSREHDLDHGTVFKLVERCANEMVRRVGSVLPKVISVWSARFFFRLDTLAGTISLCWVSSLRLGRKTRHGLDPAKLDMDVITTSVTTPRTTCPICAKAFAPSELLPLKMRTVVRSMRTHGHVLDRIERDWTPHHRIPIDRRRATEDDIENLIVGVAAVGWVTLSRTTLSS